MKMAAYLVALGLFILSAQATGQKVFSAGEYPIVIINRSRSPKQVVINRYHEVIVSFSRSASNSPFSCSVYKSSKDAILDKESCGIFHQSDVISSIEPDKKGVRKIVVAWVPEDSSKDDIDLATPIGAERFINSNDLESLVVHGTMNSEYAFTVRSDGHIKNCHSVAGAPMTAFDAKVCLLLTQRALFLPARDATGAVIESLGHRKLVYISNR